MVTARLANLIGAPICGIALYDPQTRMMEPALPIHGLTDQAARRFRYPPRPEYRSLWSPRTGRPYVSNQPASDPRLAQQTALLAEPKQAVTVPPLSAALEACRTETASELAVPVRAGDHALGVLAVRRRPPIPFEQEETNLLSTLAGHLALALRRAESEAATEHMARQMATLYDLGLETAALRDLRALFIKATEEAGRLMRAEHTSVFRF